VRFHGADRDVETVGDLAIGETGSDELEDLGFAVAEG
jgi:hypothetical protein